MAAVPGAEQAGIRWLIVVKFHSAGQPAAGAEFITTSGIDANIDARDEACREAGHGC